MLVLVPRAKDKSLWCMFHLPECHDSSRRDQFFWEEKNVVFVLLKIHGMCFYISRLVLVYLLIPTWSQGFTNFIMVHKIIKMWKTHDVVELGLPPCWLFCLKGKDTKVRMVLKCPKPREIATWLQMWRSLYMQHGNIQWSWMSLMEICVLRTLWFIFLHQCQLMYAIIHSCRHDVNFMHKDKFACRILFIQKLYTIDHKPNFTP